MSKIDYRNIDKTAGVCGGRAVIAGTRIRVSLIWQLYRQGMRVDDIARQYPHLRPADIHDALAYAHDHPAEIDADIADDDEDAVRREYPARVVRKPVYPLIYSLHRSDQRMSSRSFPC